MEFELSSSLLKHMERLLLIAVEFLAWAYMHSGGEDNLGVSLCGEAFTCCTGCFFGFNGSTAEFQLKLMIFLRMTVQ